MKTSLKLLPGVIGLLLVAGVLLMLQAGSSRAAPLTQVRTVTQTTVADFNRGVFYQTGMTRIDDGEVTLLRVGIAGEWITTTNSTGLVPRFEHASIAYNSTVYVFGGRTGSGALRSIQYARVNTDTHNLSNWVTATTSLSTNIYTSTGPTAGVTGLSAVVLGGRVYLLGGEDGGAFHYRAVSFATLNSDGSLGPLIATTPLPQPLWSGQAVVLNGVIYYVGGRTDPSSQGSDKVYYAIPDPASGQITTWHTATGLLPYKTYNQMSVATVNDHLYAMAGVTVTAYNGIVPDVYYAAPLTITGNITQWQVTRALPRNIFGGAAVTFGGQIYDIGGALDGISDATDKVFAAFEQPTGGVLTWIATTGITPSRLLHTAVMNADGWIYVIGGSTGLNQPIQQNIVNVGATTGESGSAYVDHGTFTSDPFDLEKNYLVRNVSWVTELSDPSVVTLTLRFRYRLSSGAYTSWSPLHPANFASGVSTTTVYLSDTARYLQYQAFFTTTDPLVSPILQSVKVTYETPEPPEFYKYANPPSGSGVKPGDRITYTLTYSNAGDSPLTHVIISDTAPISTSYVAGSISSSPPVTMHAELAPRLFWDIGTLPGHSGGTLGFIVIVGSQVQEGDEIQNTANLDSDTIAARSTLVYHTIGVPPVLIKSHVTSAPAQTLGRVQPGDLITYTLMYSNPHTTLPLSGAIITDVLPLSVTYLSSFGSIAPDLSLLGSQRIIRWSIGTVPTRTSGTVGYAVQVVSNVALVPDGGAIVNTAQLGASGRRTIESQDSVPVRYRFDLLLSKSDGLRKARPGDSLTYTIRLTNVTNLPVTATGIVVHDYLEPGQPGDQPGALQCVSPCPGWSFVEIDPDGNQVYARTIPALGPNQSTTISMVVQVSPTLLIDAPDVLSIANFAAANADGLHGVEINPLNQIDEDVDVIAGPDILVTGLKASSANVLPNTPASFYATLKNDGWNTTLGPDGTGWFGVDLYVKPAGSPPPNGPGDRYLGACPTPTNYCPNAIRWDYYRVAKFYTTTVGAGGLAPGETWQLTYTLPITPAGTYWLYVQADTYWGEPSTTTYGTPLHGRIKEGIESNNIFGPIEIEVGYQHLYLPLIFKQFP